MGRALDTILPDQPEPYRFLGRAISRMRWITLAVLLLLALVQPTTGRAGLQSWTLILAFAGYNLLVGLLRNPWPWLRSFGWVAALDVSAAGLLYFLGNDPSGPLFVLFFLAAVCVAASMSLRGSLLYTAIVVAVVALIHLTFSFWSPANGGIRQLGAWLVILALVGVGTTVLTRRMALEREAAVSVRGEAERLEELDRLRADFISTVSHDLLTPLTAARAGLGLLETSMVDQLPAAERELLGDARGNIERLGLLIDDLLAFNQLEAGTLRLQRESLDLRTIILSAMSAVHPLIKEKGQPLAVDLPAPLLILGDARRLEQVIVNVLVNVYRHTPSGTRVMISGRTTVAEVVLAVSDNGPGIPAEELEVIFRRFHRLSLGDVGSGLGLAISRGIVELHGGRIWAESRSGKGATFRITLPHHVNGGE